MPCICAAESLGASQTLFVAGIEKVRPQRCVSVASADDTPPNNLPPGASTEAVPMSAVANVTWIARDEAAGDTVPAALFDLHWEPPVPTHNRVMSSWKQYVAIASQVVGRFHGQFRMGHFDYAHPTRLQPETVRRLKRPYKVNVAYSDWGPADAPVVICLGGVASVAMRFRRRTVSGCSRVGCA